jgi:hypothetical protein
MLERTPSFLIIQGSVESLEVTSAGLEIYVFADAAMTDVKLVIGFPAALLAAP